MANNRMKSRQVNARSRQSISEKKIAKGMKMKMSNT